jgi:thioredoxin-related protein
MNETKSHHPASTAVLAILAAVLLLGTSGCQTSGGSGQAENDVFDESTSGRALVNAALESAKAGDQRVILLFGANWCPYCRKLHAMLESDPAVSPLVRESFVVVPIDVGTSARNRNTALIDRYDSNVFTDGTPSVVIINADGHRGAPTDDNPGSAKNPLEAERVKAFLTRAMR